MRELDAAVAEITGEIAKKSPLFDGPGSASACFLQRRTHLDPDKASPMLYDRLAECPVPRDAREGLMAFLEKRPPI
jgi:enoyl-CoA hydratase/carnithine racemase